MHHNVISCYTICQQKARCGRATHFGLDRAGGLGKEVDGGLGKEVDGGLATGSS